MQYSRANNSAYYEVIPQPDGAVIVRVYSRKDGLVAEKETKGSPDKWIEAEMKKWEIKEAV